MKQPRMVLIACLLAGSVILALPGDAHAYLDPGTGSYVLQLILAGLLGAAFTVKIFWRRIRSFILSHVLKRKGQREESSPNEYE